MNKILTFEGGQPFTTDDLAFLQNNFGNMARTLVRSLLRTNQDCILWGIKTGEDTKTAQGAVYINGDIYILDEPLSGEKEQYYLCISQEESKPRLFRDNQTHNVYLTDSAYMSETATATSIDLRNAVMLLDLMTGTGDNVWEDFTESVQFPENVTGTVLIRPSTVYAQFDKRFKVSIEKNVDDGSNEIFSTPFRDPEERTGIVLSNRKILIIEISRNGMLVFNSDGTPYTGPLSLTNVEF